MRRLIGVTAVLLSCATPARNAHAPAPAPVKLWFGGDVNLGDGAGHALEPLRPLIASMGIGVVNLEGPVASALPAGEGLKLFNAPGALPQLRALGVQVVGIANNHALDTGPDGPEQTRQAVLAAGLLPASSRPALLEVGGIRIAITAHDLEHGVPPTLAAELHQARGRGELLVATFHVTGPARYLPRPELQEAVRIALDAGARVVIAHGTHAVAPLERRGDALVAWGLGNVCFACACTDEHDAFLLGLTLAGPRIDAELIPIDAGLRAEPARAAKDPDGLFDLLEAIGTPTLQRHGDRASLP